MKYLLLLLFFNYWLVAMEIEKREPVRIETDRLIIREWDINKDLYPFITLKKNEDDQQNFSKIKKQEAEQFIIQMQSHINEHGCGVFALELKKTNELIGCGGIMYSNAKFPKEYGQIEAGGRIGYDYQGQGYGKEATTAIFNKVLIDFNIGKVVVCVPPNNLFIIKFCEEVGLFANSNNNFLHPCYPKGSPLRKCKLYAITRKRWIEKNKEPLVEKNKN